MRRILINERHVKTLDHILPMVLGKEDKDMTLDIIEEMYYRTFSREFIYKLMKAQKVLSLGDTLDEAKTFMGD